MSVVSLAPRDGLSPAEVAQLVIFAARSDIAIETGTTNDGSRYAALHVEAVAGLDHHAGMWVVSRERGRVVTFNEVRGRLPHRWSVDAVLIDLAGLLPANTNEALDVSSRRSDPSPSSSTH